MDRDAMTNGELFTIIIRAALLVLFIIYLWYDR